MDVSTHPPHDTPPTSDDPAPSSTLTLTLTLTLPPTRRAGAAAARRGRLERAGRALGFHLVALAGFTVPAVALWWHVWSGHPSSTLTCGCGDPAQEVWFMAWPAWAIAHLHNVFFSGAVNVPDGANLLSNTSGTLVGVVLAPVTWLFGPVAATNVAAHPRTGPQRVGLLRRRPPPGHVEARRHPGRAGLRLLGRHRVVADVRPRVGHLSS